MRALRGSLQPLAITLGAGCLLAASSREVALDSWVTAIRDLEATRPMTPWYPLYSAVLGWLHETCGLGFFTAARWTSLACTAAALGILYAAAARLVEAPARVTGLCAMVPAVWLLGLVPNEFCWAFLGSCVTTWLACTLIHRPTALRALATGLVAGLSSWGHVANVWVILPLTWLLVSEWRSTRPAWACVTTVVISHGLTALALDALQSTPDLLSDPRLRTLSAIRMLGLLDAATWLQLLHHEWLRAYLPLSVLLLVALVRGRYPGRGLALLLILPAYLMASWLFAPKSPNTGLVCLPLAFPAALLVVRSFGPRTAWAAVVAGLCVSALALAPRQAEPRTAEFGAGLQRYAAEQPSTILFFGNRIENESLLIQAPEVRRIDLQGLLQDAKAQGLTPQVALDQRVATEIAAGRRVAIGIHTMELLLRAPPQQPQVVQLRQRIQRGFAITRIQRGRFRGLELTPRR